MAFNPKFFANLGKSVAYSALNVTGDLMPNSAAIARNIRSGADMTRDFIRTNQTRLRNITIQNDRSQMSRKAKAFMSDAWSDVKQGNLALGDLSNQAYDEYDAFTSKIDDDSDEQRMEPEDGSAIEEPVDQVAAPPGDFRVLAGMQHVSNTIGTATLKGFEYQTSQLNNTLFAQMAASNQHFTVIEKQLSAIHDAINQQSEFMRDSQGVTNQAQLAFFDQVSQSLQKMEKREKEREKRTKRGGKSANEAFLGSSYFDLDSYMGVIKENMDNSPIGAMASMMGMLSPDMLKMAVGGPDGKIQPQKLLLTGLMHALIPPKARRSAGRADSQVNTMFKTLLTNLGDKRYDMANHPILGTLGQIFGLDSRAGGSLNIGKYKKESMNWNGEAQHALTSIIPKELAEIKAAITGRDAEYFDSRTGKFFSEDKVRENVRLQYQKAIEQPFANIFNSMSTDPDEMANKKFWNGMSEAMQDAITAAAQKAIDSKAGATMDIRRELDSLMRQGVEEQDGGTKVDSQRMVMQLIDAVNQARNNRRNFMDQMEQDPGAFGQISSKLADDRGFISFSKLSEYLGGGRIDLKAANGGRYSMSGERLDLMNEEVRDGIIAQEGMMRGMYDRIRGLSESQNALVRLIGKAINKGIDYERGEPGGPWANRLSGGIDDVSHEIYRRIMLGEGGRILPNLRDNDQSGIRPQPPQGGGSQNPPTPPRTGGIPPTQNEQSVSSAQSEDEAGDDAEPPSQRQGILLDESQLNTIIANAVRAALQEQSEQFSQRSTGAPLPYDANEMFRQIAATVDSVKEDEAKASPIQPASTSASIARGAENSNQNPNAASTMASLAESNSNQDPNAVKGGGITNEAYDRSVGKSNPDERTAEATEATQEQIEEAYGPKGFMRKVFDNPLIKSIFEKFKKSKVGQAIGKQVEKGKDYFKKLFMEDYVDEAGEVHKSVFNNLKDMGSQYKSMIMKTLGFDEQGEPDEDAPEGTVAQAAQEASEEMKETTEALIGGDSEGGTKKKGAAKKAASGIMKSLNETVRKHGRKVLTGGVLGAAAGIATGGHLGLIGSMFLPGGPVGGAIAGMGISMLANTEAVQSMLFGKKGADGERQGGLINKEMREGFKKAIPTLGMGAGAGILLKVLSGVTGIGSSAAAVGGIIPGMLGPGGVMGAAIMGSAAAFALKNEKVQDILFGPADENGARSGALLSNLYNKFTGKVQGETQKGKKSLGKKALNLLKWAGMGAVGGATLSQLGILGGALSFGGPIGAAIAGATVGIFASEDRFNNYLFGTEDDKGKRKKDGLFSRISTAIQLNLLEPAKNWFQTTAEQFAWHLKAAIEVPARLAFGPIVDGFKDIGQGIKMSVEDAFKAVAEKTAKTITGILKPIGSTFMKLILKPLGGLAGGLIKGGLFAAGSIAGAPLQLLANLMMPKRRKGNRALSKYMRENKEEILQRRWAEQEANGEKRHKIFDRMQMGLASMRGPFGTLFHSNDVSGDAARQFMETEEGQQYDGLNWLSARSDKRQYLKNKKEAGKAGRERSKVIKLRAKWAKEDGNNQDAVLTEDQFKQRKKLLKKHGIDVNSEEELKQVMYHYDAWERARNAPPTEEAEPEETPVDEINSNVEEVQEKQDEQTGILRGLLNFFTGRRTTPEEDAKGETPKKSGGDNSDGQSETTSNQDAGAPANTNDQSLPAQAEAQTETAENTAEIQEEQKQHTTIFHSIADTAKAIFDLISGKSVDTEDVTGSLADEVDDDLAETAQATNAQVQGKAIAQEMAAMNAKQRKSDERNAEHARVTGNDSGSAYDLNADYTNANDEQSLAQAVIEDSDDDNDQGGGFLGGILNNFLSSAAGIAAIGGLIMALLSNKELRDMLFSLLGDLVGDLPQLIKTLGETVKDVDDTMSGDNGGINNSRTLTYDEEGNPDETVTNTKYEEGKFNFVRHGVQKGLEKVAKKAGKGAVKLSKRAAKLTKAAGGDPSTVTRYKMGKDGDGIFSKLFGTKKAQEMTAEEVAEEGTGFFSKFFKKKGAKTATDAAADAAGDVIEGQLSLFGDAATEGAEQATKGGVFSRIGNFAKKTVDDLADTKLGKGLASIAESAKNSKVGQAVTSGISAAKNTVDDAAKAAGNSKLGQTVTKGLNSLKSGVDDAAQKLAGSKAGKTASKVWGGVKEVTAKVVEDSNEGVFSKILNLIKEAVDGACKKSGFAETAVGKVLKKFSTFIDDIIKKCAGKLAKWSDDLAGALATMSAKAASWATPMAVINATITAVETADAAINPEMIFKINEDHVDGTMRLVAGAIQFLLSFFGVGAIIEIVSAIVAECCGFDFIQTVACMIYNALVNDEEKSAALQEAIDNMKQEVANYNEANGTNLSYTAYNDLKNKGMMGTAWNWMKNLVGKGDKTDYSQYEVGKYESPTATTAANPQGMGPGAVAGANAANNATKPVGMGPGMQNDQRWANMPIGTMPNGQTSTMATGGCGPTALSNAANKLGYGTNPVDMANMAMSNNYISQGGATAGLFEKGAKQIGLDSKKVDSGGGIVDSLRNGRPVILSGKSSGYGGDPYTKAGHIVTATGMDAAGNVQVDDPMRGTGMYKLSDLTSNMTGGWSIGKEQKNPQGYGVGPEGYGLTDSIFGNFFNEITGRVMEYFGLSREDASGATDTDSDTGNNGGGSGGSNITSGRTYTNELGSVSALFESSGNPATVSSGKGDAGGRSFGSYQFPSYKNTYSDSNSMLAQFWNKYYGDKYPGVKPGDNEAFINAWQTEANSDTEGFHSHEHEFITDSYYKPIVNRNSDVMDPDAHSRAAQEIWWSTGVQFGSGTKILRRALEGKNPQQMSDVDLINTVMDYKTNKIPDYFPGSKGCWKGLENRFNINERNALLELAGQDPIGETAKPVQAKEDDKPKVPHNYHSAAELLEQDDRNLGYGPGPEGYGLTDGIFGTFFSAITDNVLKRFGIEGGSANATTNDSGGWSSSGGSGGWVPPAEDNTNYAAMPTSDQQVALVNKMKSIAGTIPYSLQGPQDPDKGSASCASTVAWAYNKVLGFKPGVGGNCVNGENHASSTNQATDDRFVTIYQNDGSNSIDFSKLQPGDIVYQNWDQTRHNGKMQHTEMYAGDGTDMSHGGRPNLGPVTKDMNDYRQKHTMLIRRYKGFMQDTTQEQKSQINGASTDEDRSLGFGPGPSAGFGAGEGECDGSAFCISKTGRNTTPGAGRPMGYGGVASENRGVETRLDTIIGIMRSIVEEARKQQPASTVNTTNNTINYGPQEQTKVQPVVVKENNRMIGRYDAQNTYLRQRHQQIASARHA